MTDIGRKGEASLISHEHDYMMERLQSLENCLDNIFYHGEVCADMRGFGGLLKRCRELRNTLEQHLPDEELLFDRLAGDQELKPLLARLRGEHTVLTQTLNETVASLEALERGEQVPEDLFVLQDKVRRFSTFMQQHIATENLYVFPKVAA